jgi:CdiI immunity protein
MTSTDDYPELSQLFGVYLNQDYEYWGNTLEAVVSSYIGDSKLARVANLVLEIDQFARSHADDLDESFSRRYGFDFEPKLWGHTSASFLAALKMQLLEAIDAQH